MLFSRFTLPLLLCVSAFVAHAGQAHASEPPRLAVLDLLNPAGLDAQAIEYLTDVLRALAVRTGRRGPARAGSGWLR